MASTICTFLPCHSFAFWREIAAMAGALLRNSPTARVPPAGMPPATPPRVPRGGIPNAQNNRIVGEAGVARRPLQPPLAAGAVLPVPDAWQVRRRIHFEVEARFAH